MKKPFLFLTFLVLLISASYCDKFSFAVFGDNRDGDRIFQNLISVMNTDSTIQFAVNTGDMTPHGTNDEYNKYWDMCKESKVRTYDVLGNHDLGFMGGGRKIFSKKYGEEYYSFDLYGYRFIVLDNTRSKGMGAKQINWLKEKLKTNNKIMVFMHKPIADPTGMYPKYVMAPASEGKQLDELLKNANVKYIFAGHIHGYGREVRNGIVNVVTGGGGAPLYLPASGGGYYNYVKVSVNGDDIKDEVVQIEL